jgi:hypothetical protein
MFVWQYSKTRRTQPASMKMPVTGDSRVRMGNNSVSLTTNVVRAGLNYRF